MLSFIDDQQHFHVTGIIHNKIQYFPSTTACDIYKQQGFNAGQTLLIFGFWCDSKAGK